MEHSSAPLITQQAEDRWWTLRRGPTARACRTRHWSTVGFRSDFAAAGGQWMFSGQVFDHAIEDVLGRRHYQCGNLFGRYSIEDDARRTQVQVYVERFDRERTRWVRNVMDTVDVDFQQERRSERHSLVWGAGWRSQHDDATLHAPAAASLRPEDRRPYSRRTSSLSPPHSWRRWA